MKKIAVSTYLPPDAIAKLDESRRDAGLSRYAWIAQAIAEKIERETK